MKMVFTVSEAAEFLKEKFKPTGISDSDFSVEVVQDEATVTARKKERKKSRGWTPEQRQAARERRIAFLKKRSMVDPARDEAYMQKHRQSLGPDKRHGGGV